MKTQIMTVKITYATNWQHSISGQVPRLMMEALKISIEERHKKNKVEFEITES